MNHKIFCADCDAVVENAGRSQIYCEDCQKKHIVAGQNARQIRFILKIKIKEDKNEGDKSNSR